MKQLISTRDASDLSAKGGAVLLREAAGQLGIAATIARRLLDTSNPLLVTHRKFAIANEAPVIAQNGSQTWGWEKAGLVNSLKDKSHGQSTTKPLGARVIRALSPVAQTGLELDRL